MQLPSLRLPAVNAGDWFEDFPVRRVTLYALYTAVLFFIFLVINFPYRILVDRILNDVEIASAEVDVHTADFAFWRGLELRGVTVRRNDWSRLPIVEVPHSYLWPGIAGLLQGRPSKATFKGDLYGGRIKARWSGGEDLQHMVVQIQDVQLARYPPLNELFSAGQIFGLLAGFVDLESRAGDLNSGKANGEIFLDRAGIEGLVFNGVPILDLSFDETKAVFSMQSGRIEIEEFSSSGPDAIISGSGQIGLRDPIEASVLDLEVTIEAAADARPEVKGLISIIPRKGGAGKDAPLSITGTLGSPRTR